jgi:hypothetical protein
VLSALLTAPFSFHMYAPGGDGAYAEADARASAEAGRRRPPVPVPFFLRYRISRHNGC